MFKKLLMTLAAAVALPLFAESDPFPAVYDEHSPSGYSGNVGIGIDGDTNKGRVGLLQGKNPLAVKDDKGVSDNDRIKELQEIAKKPKLTPEEIEKAKSLMALLEKKYGDLGINVTETNITFNTRIVYCFMGYSGGEDSRAFHLYGNVGISKDQYTKVIFTFIPRRNGFVNIGFGHGCFGYNWYDTKPNRTPYKYPNFGFARYAKIQAKGTTIRDGNIGNGKAWGCGGKFPCFPDKIKNSKVTEPSGQPVMSAWRTWQGFGQQIPVKANKEILVTFYVKGDKCYSSKK